MLQVKYTSDKRSVWVTTNEKAPGGVRTEKVGLPYDPDLFDHMVEHGVHIEVGVCHLHERPRLAFRALNLELFSGFDM